jgi:cytochrome c biogenesis protein CcdA
MLQLLPRLIVVGLGASVSPVAVTVLISLMFRKKPVKNALLFLLGFSLVLIGMGVAGLLLLHLGLHHKKTAADGYVDIALGALCLLMIPFAWKKKSRQEKPEAGDMKAAEAFTLGCATMLVNFTTIPIYIGGLHMISDARLPFFDDVLAMIVLTFVTLLTLIIPIVAYVAFPRTAEKALSDVRAWLFKNQKVIRVAILLIFGIYLLIKGLLVVF